MPIGGANGIGWDESSPSVSESAGLGASRIQSLETSLRQALDSEHNWPSAGGANVGYHRYGSARAYVGTQSQVSSSGSDGRLMQTSDTSQLFGVGSGGTTLLGGPRVISMADFPGTVPQRFQWVDEWGYGVTSSSGSTVVTIPNSGYSGVPYVMAISRGTGPGAATSAIGLLSYTTVDGATFHVRSGTAGGGASLVSGIEFTWFSRGTRAL